MSSAPSGVSKMASMAAVSSPVRTRSAEARPPTSRPTAPTRMDLPAPVSPVRTLRPGSNSSSSRSMTARLRMREEAQHGRREVPSYQMFDSATGGVLRCREPALSQRRVQRSVAEGCLRMPGLRPCASGASGAAGGWVRRAELEYRHRPPRSRTPARCPESFCSSCCCSRRFPGASSSTSSGRSGAPSARRPPSSTSSARAASSPRCRRSADRSARVRSSACFSPATPSSTRSCAQPPAGRSDQSRRAAAGRPTLKSLDAVDRALLRATTVEITKLEHRVPFLATTASITPFIGLFGTVWGIMSCVPEHRRAGLDEPRRRRRPASPKR